MAPSSILSTLEGDLRALGVEARKKAPEVKESAEKALLMLHTIAQATAQSDASAADLEEMRCATQTWASTSNLILSTLGFRAPHPASYSTVALANKSHDILAPLLLASASRHHARLAPFIVAVLHRLVSHRAVSRSAVPLVLQLCEARLRDHQDLSGTGGSNSASASMASLDTGSGGVSARSSWSSSSSSSPVPLSDTSAPVAESVQLRVLQCVVSLVMTLSLSGEMLAKSVVLCLTLQQSRAKPVSSVAAASTRQLLVALFDRCAPGARGGTRSSGSTAALEGSDMPDEPGHFDAQASLVPPSLGLTRLEADAYLVLQDLCLLAAGDTPLWLHARSIPLSFAFELLESVLDGHANLFQQHPAFESLLRDRVCPLLVRGFRLKARFPTTVRLMRLVSRFVLCFSGAVSVAPTTSSTTNQQPPINNNSQQQHHQQRQQRDECEVFLTRLIRLLESPDAHAWIKALCLEVFVGFARRPPLLSALFYTFDLGGDGSCKVFTAMLQATDRLTHTLLGGGGAGTGAPLKPSSSFSRRHSAIGGGAAAAVALNEAAAAAARMAASGPAIHLSSSPLAPVPPASSSTGSSFFSFGSSSTASAQTSAVDGGGGGHSALRRSSATSSLSSSSSSSSSLSSSSAAGVSGPSTHQLMDMLHVAEPPDVRTPYFASLIVDLLVAVVGVIAKQTESRDDRDNMIAVGMAESGWPSLLGTISLLLARSADDQLTQSLLKAVQSFINSAGTLQLATPRDAFLVRLCAFVLTRHDVPSGGSPELAVGLLAPKNVLGVKALLNVAHCLGSVLRSGWFVVLETLENLDRLLRQPGAGSSAVGVAAAAAERRNQQSQLAADLESSEFDVLRDAVDGVFRASRLLDTRGLNDLLDALSQLSFPNRFDAEASAHSSFAAEHHPASSDTLGPDTLSTATLAAAAAAAVDGERDAEVVAAELAAAEVAAQRARQAAGGRSGKGRRKSSSSGSSGSGFGAASQAHSGTAAGNDANNWSSKRASGMGGGAGPVTRSGVTVSLPSSYSNFAIENLAKTVLHNLHRIDQAWAVVSKHLLYVFNHENEAIRRHGGDALVQIITSTFQLQAAPGAKATAATTSRSSRGLDDPAAAATGRQLSAVALRMQMPMLQVFEELSRSPYFDTREKTLDCLHLVMQSSGEVLQGDAWNLVLRMLGQCAGSADSLTLRGFKNVELVCRDFLATVPLDAVSLCIDAVGGFAQQQFDLNVSLTAIGLLWDVLDFLASRQRDDGTAHASTLQNLWRQAFGQLEKMAVDRRPEVRNGALMALFKTLTTHGDQLAVETWDSVLNSILFPLLVAVKTSGRYAAASQAADEQSSRHRGRQSSSPYSAGSTAANQVQLHYSRNTAQKQWAETEVLAIEGVTGAVRKYLGIMRGGHDFASSWRKLFDILESFVAPGNVEVSIAVIGGAFSLLETLAGPLFARRLWEIGFASCSAMCTALTRDASAELAVDTDLLLHFVKSLAVLLANCYEHFTDLDQDKLFRMLRALVAAPTAAAASGPQRGRRSAATSAASAGPTGSSPSPVQLAVLDIFEKQLALSGNVLPATFHELQIYLLASLGEGLANRAAIAGAGAGAGAVVDEDGVARSKLTNGDVDRPDTPLPTGSNSVQPRKPEVSLATGSSQLSLAAECVRLIGRLYPRAKPAVRVLVLQRMVKSVHRALMTKFEMYDNPAWRAALTTFGVLIAEGLGAVAHEQLPPVRVNVIWTDLLDAAQVYLLADRALTCPDSSAQQDARDDAQLLELLRAQICQHGHGVALVFERFVQLLQEGAALASQRPQFARACFGALFELSAQVALDGGRSTLALASLAEPAIVALCDSALRALAERGRQIQQEQHETPTKYCVLADDDEAVLNACLVMEHIMPLELPPVPSNVAHDTSQTEFMRSSHRHLVHLLPALAECVGIPNDKVNQRLKATFGRLATVLKTGAKKMN